MDTIKNFVRRGSVASVASTTSRSSLIGRFTSDTNDIPDYPFNEVYGNINETIWSRRNTKAPGIRKSKSVEVLQIEYMFLSE